MCLAILTVLYVTAILLCDVNQALADVFIFTQSQDLYQPRCSLDRHWEIHAHSTGSPFTSSSFEPFPDKQWINNKAVQHLG